VFVNQRPKPWADSRTSSLLSRSSTALADSVSDVSQTVADALAVFADEAVVNGLIHGLSSNKRASAKLALRRWESPESTRRRTPDRKARRQCRLPFVGPAAKSLGKLNNKEAASALVKLLDDDTSEVQEEAIAALETLGDAISAEPLTRAHWHIKVSGCAAAQQLRSRRLEMPSWRRHSSRHSGMSARRSVETASPRLRSLVIRALPRSLVKALGDHSGRAPRRG